MIILAVRGRRKNLVIDRNSIVKNENLKIFTKTHVIYLKRKLRTCKMQIQVEKVWFVTKKMEKFNFEFFFSKGGPFDVKTVKNIFSIFQKFQNKISQVTFMGPFKHKKEQSQEFWVA